MTMASCVVCKNKPKKCERTNCFALHPTPFGGEASLKTQMQVAVHIVVVDNNYMEIPKGEPVPFIIINEKIQAGKTLYTFEIHRQAVEVFNSVRNKRIAIATVAGPQRSGKSFLSNRLLKRMKGFAIGPSTMPCTKGLWIWGEPIQISEDTVLIIMDTEGLNSVQRDINVDLKIFSLSILLSSVFIYNSLGHIDERALENMSYVLKVSENLRMKSESEGDSETAKCFPYFYWVLRDFTLDLKGMTDNEYLQQCLRPVSADEKDPKNQVRSKIRKLFLRRRCECFPRPISDNEDRLAHIEEQKYEDLREVFRDKMGRFEKTFFETLPVKEINGKALTGDIYLNMVREYVEAINTGKVPEVLNTLERVLESEARKISENMRANYKEAMSKAVRSDKPVDEQTIERYHRDFLRKIEEKLNEKFKSWQDIGRTKEYTDKLMKALETDHAERMSRNSKMNQLACNTQFGNFWGSYGYPEVRSVEMLTESLIKEKYQEFMRKIQPFFENCKEPRKFTFFTEKYPKAVYEYFDIFFARMKGLYNEEMNCLRVEIKNAQGQTASVKRIMKEQESLLLEKQKEVDALAYERDLLKREFQRQQKIKDFEKETEKMSKGELKKSLETYRAELFMLQERNQELEKQLEEATSERARKVSLERHVENVEPAINGKYATSELFTTLTSLTETLVTMRDFYEKNVVDYEVDDNVNRQIQNLRSEKHNSLIRVREEAAAKKEEYRKQMLQARGESQRHLQVLNRHLDDIKSENMELTRRLGECPSNQAKLKNFIKERRQFEESLKLKQNNINMLMGLNQEKQKKIEQLLKQSGQNEEKLAILKAENANFSSYKQTYSFILRESLNWALNRNHKFKHSIKTLMPEDSDTIRKVFKELGLDPFR